MQPILVSFASLLEVFLALTSLKSIQDTANSFHGPERAVRILDRPVLAHEVANYKLLQAGGSIAI